MSFIYVAQVRSARLNLPPGGAERVRWGLPSRLGLLSFGEAAGTREGQTKGRDCAPLSAQGGHN